MNRVGIATLLVLAVACVRSEEPSVDFARSDDLLGTYTSVSESACNVELDLLSHGEAKINRSCRIEDGSGRDERTSEVGAWSIVEGTVKIESGGIADVFEYDQVLNYSDLRMRGSGPGLRPVGVPREGSGLRSYGPLWKRPIP